MEAKVRVVVRVRPFLGSESTVGGQKTSATSCITLAEDKRQLELRCSLTSREAARHTFDACYGPASTQEEMFTEVEDVVDSVLKGINTAVFAYGMTGAGKTHTMQGSAEAPGIIPRVVEKLTNKCREGGENVKTRITVSYLEIYNERVYDLLNPADEEISGDLAIRQNGSGEIAIPGLERKIIKDPSDFDKVYQLGCKNRRTASTSLNSASSRSHAILSLEVKMRKDNVVSKGKLHLIDLAGSEDNRHTNNTGMRMTESSSINTSLFVLGKVVNALNDAAARVPYRDSKLTRLLQDSLGGKSNAILIANVAPGSAYYLETTRTLNFASKSRKIVNKPVVHEHNAPSAATEAANRKKRLEEWQRQRGKLPVAAGPPGRVGKARPRPSMAVESERKRRKLGGGAGKLDAVSKAFIEEEVQRRLQEERRALQEARRTNPKRGDDADWEPDSDEEMDEEEYEDDDGRGNQENVSPPRQPAAIDVLRSLTPNTKVSTAKEFLAKGRAQEQKGQESNALALYQHAFKLFPTKNVKLQAKIEALQKRVAQGAAAAGGGDQPVNPQSAMEAKVLEILNTGTKKELCKLHTIGEKRAQLILQYRGFNPPLSAVEELRGFVFTGNQYQNFVDKNIQPGLMA